MFCDSDFEVEHYDDETGEIIIKTKNPETGETESIYILPQSEMFNTRSTTNKPFKIPISSVIDNGKHDKVPRQRSSNISAAAILYLLPTTIFFYPILSIILVVVEIILHIWAHKKNKSLKLKDNKTALIYRSPLHVICKEFCGSCKEMEASVKIEKIQDKRTDKIHKYGLEYVPRIVT